MFSKLAALFGSIRFWQITFAAVTEIAAHFTSGPNGIYHVVAAWLASIATIGTVDKAAKSAATTIIKEVQRETLPTAAVAAGVATRSPR